jgi:hypothetical protein
VSSNLLSGKFMTADLAGIGEIVSDMSLITSLTASISGVGSLSGTISATLGLVASLAGTGSMTASMALLIPLQASLSGVGSIVANLKGNADMAAHIFVNSGAATTEELVAAIWSAIAADYNESGTMGQKLNGAGSAGDPWTTDLSTYNTVGTAGKIVKDNPALLDIINEGVQKASLLIPHDTDL